MTGAPGAAFESGLKLVLEHEGGFECDPADAGNWTGGKAGLGALRGTNMGISAASYPDLEDIKGLTLDQARAIYLTDFWIRYRLGGLPAGISPKVLDTAVLAGPKWAIIVLQRALNALGRKLVVDGALGDRTYAAAGAADPDHLLAAYRTMLAAHYDAIVAEHPNEARFQRGWDSRALS